MQEPSRCLSTGESTARVLLYATARAPTPPSSERVLQRQLHLEEVRRERLLAHEGAAGDEVRVEVVRGERRVERARGATAHRQRLLLRERRAQHGALLLTPLILPDHPADEVAEVEDVQLRRN